MLTDLQKRTAQAVVNIFETGKILGDYASVTVLPGDPGHLTYGRSQTTLMSGNLHLLIKAYCDEPHAAFGGRLRQYLGKLASKDTALDGNRQFRDLLHQCGADPVMRDVQDRFFDRVYWAPSVTDCLALGVGTPLGTTVVYDSRIHGSWALLRARTEQRHGTVSDTGERAWIEAYVNERRDWLANHPKPILHATVYRMDSFKKLIGEGSWLLPLPLRVRGLDVDEEALLSPPVVQVSAAGEDERTLLRRRPPMRGPDVVALQKALGAAGFRLESDGVFGDQTEAKVRTFQRARGLKVDGIVGPATRSALGL